MEKKISTDGHCPYCKRHCSLKNPHCGKGKALAEKMEGKIKAKVEEKSESVRNCETVEWKMIQTDIKLLNFCQNNGWLLCSKKAGKHGDKMAMFSILASLVEKGVLTQKALKESCGLDSVEFKRLLQKLEKKEYVRRKKDEAPAINVFLTEKGLKSAQKYRMDWEKENKGLLASLTEEEKICLERILKKIRN